MVIPQLHNAFRMLCSKGSAAAIQVLEDTLRWGAEPIFTGRYDPTRQDPASPDSDLHPPRPESADGDTHMGDTASPHHRHADPHADPNASPRHSPAGPSVTSPFSAPEQQHQAHRALEHSPASSKLRYTDDVVEKLLQWATAVAAEDDSAHAADDAEAASAVPAAATKSLGQVLGASWGCVRVHRWHQDAFDEELQGDEAEDEENLEDMDLPTAEASGDVGLSRGESGMSAAHFWESLLRDRYEQVVRQDEAAIREQWQGQHGDLHVSPMPEHAGSTEVYLCFFNMGNARVWEGLLHFSNDAVLSAACWSAWLYKIENVCMLG